MGGPVVQPRQVDANTFALEPLIWGSERVRDLISLSPACARMAQQAERHGMNAATEAERAAEAITREKTWPGVAQNVEFRFLVQPTPAGND
jgi:hypothetical protein